MHLGGQALYLLLFLSQESSQPSYVYGTFAVCRSRIPWIYINERAGAEKNALV
jgi:hypothetical protein